MINFEQGTPEWHDFRKTHIGSSEIAAIMGVSPWKSPYSLWLEKTGKKKEDEPNFAMQRGVVNENRARLQYSKVTGNEVMPNILVSDEWPVALASLDGITMDKSIICEIKCPQPKNFEKAERGEVPNFYYAQIQWQLWVSGASKCDYFVFIDEEKYKCIDVFPDAEYQKKLVIAAKEFWGMVISNEAPELSEMDFLCVDDMEASIFATKWRSLKEQALEIAEQLENLESTLLEFSDDGNCYFGKTGVQISRVNRKGNVDWVALCKEKGISEQEVEKFRKKSIGYPKFSIKKQSGE